MHSRLTKILVEKEQEIRRLKRGGGPAKKGLDVPPVRDFRGAISVPGITNLIAEIKFASPSAGIIREKSDPISIGRIYEKSGAAAISLITDKRFFGGDIDHLSRLKKRVSLPVLRKDFIIDPVQVEESFVCGADAILLIVRILSEEKLKEMLSLCNDMKMAALTEVHNRTDLEKAIDAGAKIIGINNRDLDTFNISLETTISLAPRVPGDCTLVSESGIMGANEIKMVKKYGINAVLVGSSIMGSDNISAKVKELVDAGKKAG